MGVLLSGLAGTVLLAGCLAADPERPSEAARSAARDVRATAVPEPSTISPEEPLTSSAPRRRAGSDVRPRRIEKPRRAHLSIPALGLRSVPVVRYPGSPDDARGTRIQDRGPTASPRGPDGGVGPGQVGNFIVTGHRTSHTAPFRDLPALRRGHRVWVRSASTVFVYRVTATRWTSFRSPRSLAEQSAAVPGSPEAEPTRAMITLSTCATPEDHAAGNFWSDRFGNPEHRIDKVGVLVAQRRTGDRPPGR